MNADGRRQYNREVMEGKHRRPYSSYSPPGFRVGEVVVPKGEEFTQHYETAAWHTRIKTQEDRKSDLRVYFFVSDPKLNPGVYFDVQGEVISCCLVSLFGGVAYGKDRAGQEEMGKIRGFSQGSMVKYLKDKGYEVTIDPEWRFMVEDDYKDTYPNDGTDHEKRVWWAEYITKAYAALGQEVPEYIKKKKSHLFDSKEDS